MKYLTLVSLFIFASCSQYKIETQLKSAKEDVLSNESFLRYSSERLESAIKKNISLSGIAQCHSGDISKGKALLKEKLIENKDSPDYWNQVATCFYLNNEYTKAEHYYQLSLSTAAKNKVKYAPSHNNLGIIYLSKRHFSLAFEEFQKALSINKSFLTPRFNLAQLYLQFGQTKEALDEFMILSRKTPNDPGVLAGLGVCYTLLNDYKKGLSYFSKIPKRLLTRPDIGTHYAMTLYLVKDYEQAYLALKNRVPTKIRPIQQTARKLLKLITLELEQNKVVQK